MSLMHIYAVLILVAAKTEAQDPCETDNHVVIKDEDGERSGGLPTAPGAVRICDSAVNEGWYRMESPAGNDMPTSCVETNHCNTEKPVWLNGDIPPADGNIHFMTAMTTISSCSNQDDMETHQVDVKNCGAFRVYFLRRLSGCPSAYCFGTTAPCPPGTSSETGRTPCATITPLNQIPTVTVRPQPMPFDDSTREIQFLCDLPDPDSVASDITLQIWWYAGEFTNEFGPFEISPRNLPHILHENNWASQGIRLGINFWCKMRARRPAEAPSDIIESNKYFAGVTINRDEYVVVRGQTVEIDIQPTVPLFRQRFLLASLIPTRYTREDCVDPDAQGSAFTTTFCGVYIPRFQPNDNWENYRTTPLPFKIYGKVEYQIGQQKAYNFDVVFQAPSRIYEHGVWNGLTVTTKVTVIEPEVTFRATDICVIDGDPNVISFDRCNYAAQYEGEFVAYQRTDNVPVQVNMYFQRCSDSSSGTCVCGVAVKSGSELFIYDQCRIRGHDNQNRPVRIGLLECAHQSMDIRETTPSNYEITLPTGTVVKIKRWTGFVPQAARIDIVPSISDVQNVRGLCGNFDGVRNNDFIHRANPGEQPTMATCSSSMIREFALSWRIDNEEESFYNELNPSVMGDPLILFCRCPAECPPTEFNCEQYITDEVDCVFDEFIDNCRKTGKDRNNLFRGECFERKRRKRALGALADTFDRLSAPPFLYDPDFDPDEPTWRNGWTETKAREACENTVYMGPAGQACSSLDIDYEVAVTFCMSDIKILGSDEYLAVGAEMIRSKCATAVNRNTSMADADGNPPAEFLNALCPDNCYNRGQCEKGICKCEEGYGANDCSLNLKAAPTVQGIGWNGVCDLSKETCAAVSVYGINIIDSSSIRCNVKVDQLTPAGSESQGDSFITPGQYRHAREIICPFTQTMKRSLKSTWNSIGNMYTIQISNDGSLFSSEVTMLAYDSTCISCDTASHLCNITGCYIDSTCLSQGQQKPGSNCLVCNPSKSQVSWTDTCNGNTASPSSTPDHTVEPRTTKRSPESYSPEGLQWWLIVITTCVVAIGIAGATIVFLVCFVTKKNKVDQCSVLSRKKAEPSADTEDPPPYASFSYPADDSQVRKENPYCELKY